MDGGKFAPVWIVKNLMANGALEFVAEEIQDLRKEHQLGDKRKAQFAVYLLKSINECV